MEIYLDLFGFVDVTYYKLKAGIIQNVRVSVLAGSRPLALCLLHSLFITLTQYQFEAGALSMFASFRFSTFLFQ